MRVHVKGPRARRALLGGLPLQMVARPHPLPSPRPALPPLQGTAHRRRAGCAVPNLCLLPATWLPSAARSCPAEPGGPAAGSQLNTSSPAAPLGAGPVAAPPPGRAGASGGEPPLHPRLHPPRSGPHAGCDWLIQTHLQRNACLRVLVGVQFKSAAPGARGGRGQRSKRMIHAPGPLPGRPLAF